MGTNESIVRYDCMQNYENPTVDHTLLIRVEYVLALVYEYHFDYGAESGDTIVLSRARVFRSRS